MRNVLIHLAAAVTLAAAKTPVFETSDASAAGSVTGFEFKKRVVVPYGVGDACVGGTDCKAFGFGGAEQSAYDAAEKLVYAVSEQKSIAVVDATTMEWKVLVERRGRRRAHVREGLRRQALRRGGGRREDGRRQRARLRHGQAERHDHGPGGSSRR